MASKHAYGLVSVEISDIAADGDVGTAWQTIGETVIGSAKITSTVATVQDFFAEESDSPIESLTTTPSSLEITWESYNLTPSNVIALYGGTGSDATLTWEAPDVLPTLYKSLRFTDKKGNVWVVARANLNSTLNVSFTKTDLGRITVTGKVLQPEKVGVKRITAVFA